MFERRELFSARMKGAIFSPLIVGKSAILSKYFTSWWVLPLELFVSTIHAKKKQCFSCFSETLVISEIFACYVVIKP